MTTEQPTTHRVLRRRSDDRVIGGVASGLGDYLNIDPLLVRIGFVGLMVFGGLGLLLYVAAWLLVPDESTDESIAQRLLGGAGTGINPFLLALLAVVAIGVLYGIFGNIADRSGGSVALFAALAVLVVGWLALRRDAPAAQAAETSEVAATAPAAAPAVVAPARRARVARPPRPRSPLGWYVLGAMLIGIGLLALVANVGDANVTLGQYFGVALGVLGIGLVIGTWWGHARLLILLGLLLLPIAAAAAYVTVPLEGGVGEQRYTPMNAAELRDEYRLAGGLLVLDLTHLDTSEPVEIEASVALGELVVRLPEDAAAEIDTDVGAGTTYILGGSQAGTDIEDRQVLDGDGPAFTLRLGAGIGSIRVVQEGSQGR